MIAAFCRAGNCDNHIMTKFTLEVKDEWIMKGHTEMNPGLCTTLLLIFKPLQDEWATKGHTHRNEPRINVIFMGQFKDEWVRGILVKKLTSGWSDTVAKWFKHLTVDQKVAGLNPTCCFPGEVFSLLLLPLGNYQAFA